MRTKLFILRKVTGFSRLCGGFCCEKWWLAKAKRYMWCWFASSRLSDNKQTMFYSRRECFILFCMSTIRQTHRTSARTSLHRTTVLWNVWPCAHGTQSCRNVFKMRLLGRLNGQSNRVIQQGYLCSRKPTGQPGLRTNQSLDNSTTFLETQRIKMLIEVRIWLKLSLKRNLKQKLDSSVKLRGKIASFCNGRSSGSAWGNNKGRINRFACVRLRTVVNIPSLGKEHSIYASCNPFSLCLRNAQRKILVAGKL